MNKTFIIVIYLVFSFFYSIAQKKQKIDSLRSELLKETNNLKKAKLLKIWAKELIDNNNDSAVILFNQAKINCEQNINPRNKLSKTILRNYNIELAEIYGHLGLIDNLQGKIKSSVENFNKALKIEEEIGDNYKGLSEAYGNLGGTYYGVGDFENARKYSEKALKIQLENGYKSSAALTYNNIGIFLLQSKNYTESKKYLTQCLRLKEELKDWQGMGMAYDGLGLVCGNQNNYDSALYFFNKSYESYTAAKYDVGRGKSYIRIGKVYLLRNDYKKAIENGLKGYQIIEKLSYPNEVLNASKLLYQIYKKSNNYDKALEMYEISIKMRDSISGSELKAQATKQLLKNEYEKKTLTDSIKNQEEKKLEQIKYETELSEQRNYIYFGIAGFVLMLLIALVSLNANKQKQKANNLIAQQKQLVEQKHKEITDSINYAERIQRSFLASKHVLDENLNEYFVLFQPKDIVSGDFYWASKLSNGNFALLTADSTGHGVPGAIMSLLNITSIESALKDGYTAPSDILNDTRKTIIERLKKDGSAEGGKDGMDASLICFDFNNNKCIYAAAHNPIWIVRKQEILVFAPDKMPIGKSDKDMVAFTQHTIEIQKGDVIYTLTDGMPDQFGGPQGKKFMNKRLKELLLGIAHLPMSAQKELIQDALTQWKGNLEQVDDICVIGVRV